MESPLLPSEGWSSPDEARERIDLASGGEQVMIRIALALWLDEPVAINDIGRLDGTNATAVLRALAKIADVEVEVYC